ncbi:flagellar filament capping protein FliD [Brevibacillus parabrevis]|uniref:flagellar filament capping protein FliD n=1 Tax=Brevibacillus parabrevis TaxID=54914 RepID=UPI002E1FE885|nr:flagellar filament capping protein FliD [Brevibacillus parabrevis]MED1722401.1 flagellar filament capping protein FliD [Brevibacillus parabrevis]
MGIRISGMASGMDTEKMIKDLMKAQREPVNRLQRSKYSVEWKRDAYREMNSLLVDLQNSMKNLRLSSSFNKKTATSENESIVSAKVVGKPNLSSYTVEVISLAKAGSPPSAEFNTGITDIKSPIGGSDFTITIGKDSNGDGTIDSGDAAIPIPLSATDTMEGVINKINSAKAGVKASFFNNKLVLTSEDGKQFEVKASGSNNLNMGSVNQSTAGNTVTPATFKINGVEYSSATNSISFDGIDITLKQSNSGAPVVISTKTDEDAVFEMIKGFVDKYNAVIETINKKISEPKYKGYQPLLDEEKEALPEKTAEKMENMARSGLLLRDPILTSGLNELRRAISTPLKGASVNTSFDTLSEIGIGGAPSGKYAYQENGKLYINESKLRESIRNNGEDVLKLFTNYSDETVDLKKKYNESGVAERLFGQLKNVMDKITAEAGSAGSIYDDSSLSKKIKQTDEEIDRWEDRLKLIEDRYWKQFTAMEQAMSKAQSQGSWFAQMLGQQ